MTQSDSDKLEPAVVSRPPICTACAHCPPQRAGTGAMCRRPLSDRIDPVNGAFATTVNTACANERAPGRTWLGLGRERCGPEGRFFAERQRPPAPGPSRAPEKRAPGLKTDPGALRS
jgi:hypothetical protein